MAWLRFVALFLLFFMSTPFRVAKTPKLRDTKRPNWRV